MSLNENLREKPVILFICNYYLPGYKAGGGLRTLVHMVERFKEKFDFRVITLDHDGDNVSYSDVRINAWNEIEGAQVFYLSSDNIKISKLRELISEVAPSLIYLNSVFSKLSIFLLTLRKLKLLTEMPVVLAPEGELSDGALQLKAYKKKSFVKFAKTVGLYKNLIWKVTAEPEKSETERFKGSGGKIFIAPNMPSKVIFDDYRQELKPKKKAGEAKMIFLSRFVRKKNFKWLVENLKEVEGNLKIDIYGPLEDELYWSETQQSIKNLSPNIQIEYKGFVAYEQVYKTIYDYQYFILPTLGENFGHVFIEALAAGCPIITSNRTPWIELERKQVGWDLPLEEPRKWVAIINDCIRLDEAGYTRLSSNARSFARQWLANPEIEENTLKVLNYGLKMV